MHAAQPGDLPPLSEVLVEVTSPATALRDHNAKLEEYTQIASLHAYVLVAQDEPKVEVFRRHEAGRETAARPAAGIRRGFCYTVLMLITESETSR